jgi:methionyl-tRNA formyltransferase
MRVVFMGTPDFAVPALERLISSEHRVAAVYAQPDKPAGRGRATSIPPVKRVAGEHGLDIHQIHSFKEAGAVESLVDIAPDVIAVAAYGLILPPEVLAVPPFGCVNIHPSLLPRHRGPTPIPAAILAGDDRTGISIMLMDQGVDSGPVLAQRKIEIAPQDTTGTLTEKLSRAGADLLMQTLPRWLSRSITPQPQREEDATYTQLISKTDGEIDWRLPAYQIWRQARAYNPWPGCYTTWKGKRLRINDALPMPGDRGEPGRVLPLEKGEMAVQTGEGILMLLTVQLEGKKQMCADEFLRGQRDFIGSLLPG